MFRKLEQLPPNIQKTFNSLIDSEAKRLKHKSNIKTIKEEQQPLKDEILVYMKANKLDSITSQIGHLNLRKTQKKQYLDDTTLKKTIETNIKTYPLDNLQQLVEYITEDIKEAKNKPIGDVISDIKVGFPTKKQIAKQQQILKKSKSVSIVNKNHHVEF